MRRLERKMKPLEGEKKRGFLSPFFSYFLGRRRRRGTHIVCVSFFFSFFFFWLLDRQKNEIGKPVFVLYKETRAKEKREAILSLFHFTNASRLVWSTLPLDVFSSAVQSREEQSTATVCVCDATKKRERGRKRVDT